MTSHPTPDPRPRPQPQNALPRRITLIDLDFAPPRTPLHPVTPTPYPLTLTLGPLSIWPHSRATGRFGLGRTGYGVGVRVKGWRGVLGGAQQGDRPIRVRVRVGVSVTVRVGVKHSVRVRVRVTIWSHSGASLVVRVRV